MSLSSAMAEKLRTNYEKLVKLNICSDTGNLRKSGRSISSGYKDLVYERLPYTDKINGQKNVSFSISQNGDLCQDPEMVLLLYPEVQIVEAYSLKMAKPQIYLCVYWDTGKRYDSLFSDLNDFLDYWLNKLINEGHGINWCDNDPSAEDKNSKKND